MVTYNLYRKTPAKIKNVLRGILKFVLPSRVFTRLKLSYEKKTGLRETEPTVEDFRAFMDDGRIDPVLRNMLDAYVRHDAAAYSSKYWLHLACKHIKELMDPGFENFKQTLALKYFTYVVDAGHPQVLALKEKLPPKDIQPIEQAAKSAGSHSYFTKKQSFAYNLLTLLLWQFTKTIVPEKHLDPLEEPLLGNPPKLRVGKKWITQDLANSALEYQAIARGLDSLKKISRIIEIGAGYGRLSYGIMQLHRDIKYIIVDIPPTLYVSQRYLSEVFPEKKIFRFREFTFYEAVKEDLEAADIAFLMPYQMDLLPDHLADLAVAVDCLQEMKPEIIDFYFQNFNRLTNYFYFKCGKQTELPFDKRENLEKDYPVRENWKKIFRHDCSVQQNYFEALYQLNQFSRI